MIERQDTLYDYLPKLVADTAYFFAGLFWVIAVGGIPLTLVLLIA